MKKLIMILAVTVWIIGCTPAKVSDAEVQATAKELDFGDYSSSTMTTKAWEAWLDKDYPSVLAYTKKVVELYGEEGKQMNAEMTGYEPFDTVHDKWALNDVGTSLWIMGDVYVTMKMYPEASQTYKTLAEDYKYAQCWDPKGWFWKPALGAANKAKKYQYKE